MYYVTTYDVTVSVTCFSSLLEFEDEWGEWDDWDGVRPDDSRTNSLLSKRFVTVIIDTIVLLLLLFSLFSLLLLVNLTRGVLIESNVVEELLSWLWVRFEVWGGNRLQLFWLFGVWVSLMFCKFCVEEWESFEEGNSNDNEERNCVEERVLFLVVSSLIWGEGLWMESSTDLQSKSLDLKRMNERRSSFFFSIINCLWTSLSLLSLI
jgi:hypothetical protein